MVWTAVERLLVSLPPSTFLTLNFGSESMGRKKKKSAKKKVVEKVVEVKKVAVEPSPSEIRKMCLEIQLGWSEDMKQRRYVGQVDEVGIKICKDRGY
jgi:hypothetical protein